MRDYRQILQQLTQQQRTLIAWFICSIAAWTAASLIVIPPPLDNYERGLLILGSFGLGTAAAILLLSIGQSLILAHCIPFRSDWLIWSVVAAGIGSMIAFWAAIAFFIAVPSLSSFSTSFAVAGLVGGSAVGIAQQRCFRQPFPDRLRWTVCWALAAAGGLGCYQWLRENIFWNVAWNGIVCGSIFAAIFTPTLVHILRSNGKTSPSLSTTPSD